jgi:hypothetical protein
VNAILDDIKGAISIPPLCSFRLLVRCKAVTSGGGSAGKSISTVKGHNSISLEEDQRAMTGADYAFLSEAATKMNYPGHRLAADMPRRAKQQPSFSRDIGVRRR